VADEHERGRLLQRINTQLSKLNNNELSRAANMNTRLSPAHDGENFELRRVT
jgi:hypothetical protein